MHLQSTTRSQFFRMILVLTGLITAVFIFRRPLGEVFSLILGACILTFFVKPLATAFEKKLSRSCAALTALLVFALVLIAAAFLVLPVMLRQFADLAHILPRSIGIISRAFENLSAWISENIKGLSLSENFQAGSRTIDQIASSTIAIAGNIADIAAKFSLMVVLCYFFLCDRDDLLLRLELMLPQGCRATAASMGHAVIREMRMYLKGQLTIALCVAALSTAGLLLLRVPSAFALGPIIGLLNMIPYFGPFIGGIPAVLIALSDSWHKAGLTLIMIIIVQQLDNNLISPRIMGNLTGMSPALVLICVFAGAQIAGVVGMLFALPVIMTFRTLFRVFVQRHENI